MGASGWGGAVVRAHAEWCVGGEGCECQCVCMREWVCVRVWACVGVHVTEREMGFACAAVAPSRAIGRATGYRTLQSRPKR